jgi:ABC-type phosphate transport system substrate-binding protein
LENDDMDDNTHLWSELDARCADQEILLSGGPFMGGDHQFVDSALFGDNSDEDIPINTPRKTGSNTYLEYFTGEPTSFEDSATATTITKEADPSKLAHHVKNNGAAITFMKYPFALMYSDIITLVPVQNKYGSMVDPSYTSILSQDYHPFARMMHINMVKNENTLRAMKGFFEFAYSAEGKNMVKECGYFPLAEWEEKVMLSVLDADNATWGDFSCSSSKTSVMEIAGSRTAYPVAKVWADVYRAKCNLDVQVRGGGSHRGADRVCGTAVERSVDIGAMSRDFVSSEAVTKNGYEYDCAGSGNKVIQIETSIEAIVVATKEGGVADKCISQLGGLTRPQLRWIFSSLTENELRYEGWSFDTVPNSDGDEATHLWSELLDHSHCPPTEIKISGSADDTTFLDFFSEEILPSYGDGEDFAMNRTDGFFQNENESELVQYLIDHEDAISFFSYSYFADHDDMIVGVKLMNENDEYVQPLRTSIEDGSYCLSRRLYMNVLDSPETLAVARPYLEMGLSDMGSELVRFTGYIPIPKPERMVMQARIRAASGVDIDHLECGPAGETVSMAGSTTTYNLAKLVGEIYEIGCDVKVEIDGGGSASGADRVCGGGAGTPVDIALMSRDWYETEGIKDGMNVRCNDWDVTRSSIQIKIASTAIALATATSGVAKECIDILGGLTKDQLRWMFSSYNEKQLEETGWNPSSLSSPDFDSSTHLWSELHGDCAATEILIAGPSDLVEDVYYDFQDLVFVDHRNGEEVSWNNRPNKYVTGGSDAVAVSFLLENDAAIAFFGINSYMSNADKLSSVPIQNSAGAFVIPHESTIQAGSYDWLSKSLYLNVNIDVETLPSTVPLVRLGLSDSGAALAEAAGYIPLVQEQREQILATLCSTEGAPPSAFFCGNQKEKEDDAEKGLSTGAIFGIVVLVVAVIGVVAAVVVEKGRYAKEADSNENSTKSPYAESRINWAQQEGHLEQQPIEDSSYPQQNLRNIVTEEDLDYIDNMTPVVV